MSGAFQHRVNRLWDSGDQANMTVPAFFWEWLNFVSDNASFSFVSYGTGKSVSGVTPPASWISTFNPTTDANPYGDNSWFVFEATNADHELNGSGTDPWQAKIQLTTTTGFDDCNSADVDYNNETETWCVCIRCSAAAGWDDTAIDFTPSGGEDISNNVKMVAAQDTHYVLDIIADNDTVFWDGAAYTGSLSNAAARSRGGYIGLLTRRSSVISYPFIMTIGQLWDNTEVATSEGAINKCAHDDDCQWGKVTGTTSLTPGLFQWPTYSLWSDGSKIEGAQVHAHDCWHPSDMQKITTDPATGEIVIPSCLVAQWKEPNKYAIMGELRLIGTTGDDWTHGTVVGTDGDWRQFCYNSFTDTGMLMRWPVGVSASWS